MSTKKYAFVFPGQGSQKVGMMSSLYENSSIVRETYEEASDILRKDFWQITKEGPKETLDETIYTQPAMLIAGVATFRAFKNQTDYLPEFFAGHSLGEYSALVANNNRDFKTLLNLASIRAKAMQNATPKGIGAMAAIIGLDKEKIIDTCKKESKDGSSIWLANDNAIGQIVIAGHKDAVDRACLSLKELGAKKALVLPVSIPSHCPLMAPAAEELSFAMKDISFLNGDKILIHNTDPSRIFLGNEIEFALKEQLTKPVRWVETIQRFHKEGISGVIEFGPGKVLSGLNKRIEKELSSIAIADYESLIKFLEDIHT